MLRLLELLPHRIRQLAGTGCWGGPGSPSDRSPNSGANMFRLAAPVAVFLGCVLSAATCPAAGQEKEPNDKAPTFRGTPVRTWIARLKDKDVAVRREAATALARRIDKAEPSAEAARALLPVLFDTLKDTDTGVRRQAALACVRSNGDYRRPQESEAQALLPVLLDALQDNGASVRMLAASSLVKVNRDEKAVLGPLTELLKDPDEGVR